MIDCARLRRPALRVLSFRRRGLDASGGLVRRRGRLRFHGESRARKSLKLSAWPSTNTLESAIAAAAGAR